EIVVLEMIGDASAVRGYGEGVPIRIVTGETPESVIGDILSSVADPSFPWDLEDVSQIWNFVDGFPDGKSHNAAICAMEMALLDALGKYQNRPVMDFFSHTHLADVVHYGAPVTLGNKERIVMLCNWIKAIGITRIRIKMGKVFDQNQQALETVVSILGQVCELRIDPNGVWDRDLAFRHLPLLVRHKVNIVEEPMERDARGFPQFVEALSSEGIILMACESAPTLKDVKRIIDENLYQMINVKLCRSGGFRKAIQMIDHIRKSPISFQIGCTLGESGILSAAGRALCLLSKDAVNYDGSYDRFLLKENTTMEHVSFGLKGEAGPLGNSGLGVQVNRQALYQLALSPTITIQRP
ncbi:MAG: hypothetical protein MUP26_08955, partial [Desulfobulbaceae bacterium]|nr:hypothetical protein [Desulfobulbaceae bacterium]